MIIKLQSDMQMKTIIIILVNDSFYLITKTRAISSRITIRIHCKDWTFSYSFKKSLTFLQSVLNVELSKVTNLEDSEAEIQTPTNGLQWLQLKPLHKNSMK